MSKDKFVLRAATRLYLTDQDLKDAKYTGPIDNPDFYKNMRAAALIMAADTKKFLFSYRSDKWDDADRWGFWATSSDYWETPQDSVRRVVEDETGLPHTQKFNADSVTDNTYPMYPLAVLRDIDNGRFCYNYLIVVDHQFEPKLNDASQDSKWVSFGDWPTPLSFGAAFVLSDRPSLQTMVSVSKIRRKGTQQDYPEARPDHDKGVGGA
jgi:hypothetical protein